MPTSLSFWIQETSGRRYTKIGGSHCPSYSAAWLGKLRHGFTYGHAGNAQRPLGRVLGPQDCALRCGGGELAQGQARGGAAVCLASGRGPLAPSTGGSREQLRRPEVISALRGLQTGLEDRQLQPRRRAGAQEADRGCGECATTRDRPQYFPGGRRGVGPAALQLELRPQLKIPLALLSLWLAVPFCPSSTLITRTSARLLPGDYSAFYQFVLTQSWLKACRGREGPRDTLSKR